MHYKEGLVSVIMPSYNTGRFISETICSVLCQSYQNFEIIIVDDCSTDETDKIVSEFQDNRIRYIKNKKNMGAAYSRNFALQIAEGEWIAFLDSDDTWEPDKLMKQIQFMQEHGYQFSCTGRDQIDESSLPLGIIERSPRHITKQMMYLYCWVGCLTVMYHAPTIGVIQIADLKKNNDYAMWLKAIEKSDCYYLDEILAHYRVRKSSISHDKLKKLIASHYNLYRIGEEKGIILSTAFMTINLIFGVCKKMFYVKKYKVK